MGELKGRPLRVWIDNRERINEAFDRKLRALAAYLDHLVRECGSTGFFLFYSFTLIFKKPSRLDEVIKNMEFIGNRSVLIIIVVAGFTGMALSFQIFLGFQLVSATNLVGPTVALGISRELGPVLTGLIVAARAGGGMAAQLGTMRVSEQIDALEVMGVDPKQYLVAPRVVAAFLVMPFLCGVFDFIAMVGSHFMCTSVLGLDEAIFFDKVMLWINPSDIYEGLFKASVFGAVFAAICTHKGYTTTGGAKGVGESTNQGVVNSMVMIIIVNFILTNFIRFYYTIADLG